MPTTHHEGFLREICDHPDDDTPRLVYADWLEEQGLAERAEFIRAQIHMTRVSSGSRRYATLRRRALQLLAEHGAAWRGELPVWARRRCEFRCGFVAHVGCTALRFIKQGEQLLRVAPVQSLRLRRGMGRIVKLAESPSLSRISALDLYGNEVTVLDVEALAASAHLRQLTSLRLGYSSLSAGGMHALAASPILTNLTSLDVSICYLQTADFAELAHAPWLARLTALKLDRNYVGTDGIRALLASSYSPRLTVFSLHSNAIRDDGAALLSASALVDRLLTLNLGFNSITTAGVRALADSPHLARLTRLDLIGNRIGDAGARALLDSPHLTALRQLDVRLCHLESAKKALRERFGSRVKI
jgi:uncharacterized protein (TIGR02996 family)